jgi:hypothetical protein
VSSWHRAQSKLFFSSAVTQVLRCSAWQQGSWDNLIQDADQDRCLRLTSPRMSLDLRQRHRGY